MAKSPQVFESAFNVYTVTGVVGEGGSGRVFAVRDTDGAEFALKCLYPDKVTDEKSKRFKNEIGFCSKTSHPNIIRVTDWGFATWDKQKCPFYVMPRFTFTLRKLLDGKMALDDILPLFSQILDGVEAAHLLRVFHRDLKPENILCDKDGKYIVVADFGIAHFEEDMLITSIETKDTARMANFCYSAPEQRLRGGVVDHRADIFALGLVLNEMFTGSIPQGEGYKTIESVAPQYCYLDPLVADMIQQDPNRRLGSIEEFKDDLIGRRNAFVSQQELDQKRREVVRAATPVLFEPIKLVALDWSSGNLIFQLNRNPEPGWVNRFQNPLGSWSSVMGAGPESFRFQNETATIRAREQDAQAITNHCKEYIEMANRGYQQDLKSYAKKLEMEQRQKLEREVQEAETRNRLLKNIKI